jgi:hypothetical protein
MRRRGVASRPRIEQGDVRNAQGHELLAQPGGAVVPVDVIRAAGEELVPRPVERMDVEDRRVLAGPLDVAVHLPERVEERAVNAVGGLAHRAVKIDRRCDRRDHREQGRMAIGEPQCPLPPHAGTENRDARRLDAEPAGDRVADRIDHESLRRRRRIEAGHDAVDPPAAARLRGDDGQSGRLEEAAQAGRLAQAAALQVVEVDERPAGGRGGRAEEFAGMAADGDRGPVRGAGVGVHDVSVAC